MPLTCEPQSVRYYKFAVINYLNNLRKWRTKFNCTLNKSALSRG